MILYILLLLLYYSPPLLLSLIIIILYYCDYYIFNYYYCHIIDYLYCPRVERGAEDVARLPSLPGITSKIFLSRTLNPSSSASQLLVSFVFSPCHNCVFCFLFCFVQRGLGRCETDVRDSRYLSIHARNEYFLSRNTLDSDKLCALRGNH